ncbi:hypothetical protein [Flavobacterium psychrophilum]|uniref:hypothetical protein n=1 Tax=Flavobacterium psychrophilum TaxID=96345 RepID=UPI001D0908A5|nr:hypothetical protein [Flavobacterium psychrophilum]MCB6089357.1 hypothetical protein [Flavobacterium psychrophilum]
MFKFEILYGFPHLVNLFSKILFLSWSCFGFLSLETDAQRPVALCSGGFPLTELHKYTEKFHKKSQKKPSPAIA